MVQEEITNWLLKGDISIQYQVYRDLIKEERSDLRKQIPQQGWGKALLEKRNADKHWGEGFYQPKWISSHYTLLDLRNLCLPRGIPEVDETLNIIIINENKSEDGGVNPARSIKQSDVCVNGMFLNYACWFGVEERYLKSIVDFILSQQLPDGGFNCQFNRSGAKHSSMHSTISLLEGCFEYLKQGYAYRASDIEKVKREAEEFLLMHRLYLSDRSGEIIKPEFLKLNYPDRWKYNILRALDYFRYSGHIGDERLENALDVLETKRRKDGCWNVQAHHPGQQHFVMEQAGKASRWNTLRALRVLAHFR